MRIKKVKCPRCRKHFDPISGVILEAQEHCTIPKCGLEHVNLAKLSKRLQAEPAPAIEDDLLELDYIEPLVIHVIDAHNKYVE